MQVIEGLDQIATPPQGVVLTIGNFDGVHRGHQRLFSLVVEEARCAGGTPVLLTFKPHPSKVLHPGRHLPLLSTREQRYRLFAAAGIEIAVVHPFTAEFSQTFAEDFIERMVLPRLNPRKILIGTPFRFGHDRRGDVRLLQALGARHGFAADGVEVVDDDGATISASRIRKALLGGDVAAGARMLGRPFEIEGHVVHGEGRGRSLAFPTANLEVENELIPADGVYVTRLRVGGGLHDSVTNIGLRPTFDRTGRAIEAHLLGFQGDLYDQPVGLLFYERLREERRFPSPEALVDQIKKDVAQARAVLAATPPTT